MTRGSKVFNLRFDRTRITFWSDRYKYPGEEEVETCARENKSRGYLTRREFLALCKWKTERTKSRVAGNSDDLVREATGIALSSKHEELRIYSLLSLHGVGWPTASVILHFWHREPYPILDYRALWSLAIDNQKFYSFSFWWSYVLFCRNLAAECGVSMRVLDRALWQYSAESQRQSEANLNPVHQI